MNISSGETLTMSLSSVWTNRFRSFLTILGIVIGITTVVTVSSLLTGLRKGIVVFFEEFGPNNVFLSKVAGGPGDGGTRKERQRKPILPIHADLIKRSCPHVQEVGMALFLPGVVGTTPLTAKVPGFENDRVQMVGEDYAYNTVSPREILQGRWYTSEEATRGAKVAVIGSNINDSLFPGGDAVGRSMTVGGAEYRVIGVFAKAKGGFFGENGLDNNVVVPLKTAQSRYPAIDSFFITAQAFPGYRDEAMDEIEFVIRRFRRTPAAEENDFNLSTADQIIKQFDKITGTIVLASIAISAVGLLVGGIGVMNIMLVSVTERTKEIGIRKAIGARRWDIVFQFLLEAVALTGVGGVVGIILSILVTLLVGVLVPSLPSEVPLWAVVTGFSVSVAVGLFFGTWPAVKAAGLDPVEALRYE